jgi:predicted GTPase
MEKIWNYLTGKINLPEKIDWTYSGFYFNTKYPIYVTPSIREDFFQKGTPMKIIFDDKCKVIYEKGLNYFRYRFLEEMYMVY